MIPLLAADGDGLIDAAVHGPIPPLSKAGLAEIDSKISASSWNARTSRRNSFWPAATRGPDSTTACWRRQLKPWSTDHSVASTVLDRALLDDILIRARSPAYGHAARHLAKLGDLDTMDLAAEGLTGHEADRAGLRRSHGRKTGFWALVEAAPTSSAGANTGIEANVRTQLAWMNCSHDVCSLVIATSGGGTMPKIDLAAVPARKAWDITGGLTVFGVNLTRLPPSEWSSQRHWHSHEDEFVFCSRASSC